MPQQGGGPARLYPGGQAHVSGPPGHAVTLGLAEGYRALRSGDAFVQVGRDVIRVRGPDAADYLHGQLSQDIMAVIVGQSAWSLILQPQGKVDALVRVTRVAGDDWLLDTDGGSGDAVVARLQRFKLRVKAEIEQLDWRCLRTLLPAPLAPDERAGDGVAQEQDHEQEVAFDWPPLRGTDLLGEAIEQPGGRAEAPPAAWEVLRIEAGIPAMGAELTDRTIPAEAGIVDRTVSFTKGCFTGQELVARIDSRGGNVPRHLRGLTIEGEPPAVGTAIEVEGKEVGSITSVAHHPDGHAVALGYVRRDVVVPAEARLAGGAVARIAALPLLS